MNISSPENSKNHRKRGKTMGKNDINEALRIKGMAGVQMMVHKSRMFNFPADVKLRFDVAELLVDKIPLDEWCKVELSCEESSAIKKLIKKYIAPLSTNPEVLSYKNTDEKAESEVLEGAKLIKLSNEKGYAVSLGLCGKFDITLDNLTVNTVKGVSVDKESLFYIRNSTAEVDYGTSVYIRGERYSVAVREADSGSGIKGQTIIQIEIYDAKKNTLIIDDIRKYAELVEEKAV